MPISSSWCMPQDAHKLEARVMNSRCPASLWPFYPPSLAVLPFRQAEHDFTPPSSTFVKHKNIVQNSVGFFPPKASDGLKYTERLPASNIFLFFLILCLYTERHTMLSGWQSDPEGHTDFQEEQVISDRGNIQLHSLHHLFSPLPAMTVLLPQ